jgi:hypothetical protein
VHNRACYCACFINHVRSCFPCSSQGSEQPRYKQAEACSHDAHRFARIYTYVPCTYVPMANRKQLKHAGLPALPSRWPSLGTGPSRAAGRLPASRAWHAHMKPPPLACAAGADGNTVRSTHQSTDIATSALLRQARPQGHSHYTTTLKQRLT